MAADNEFRFCGDRKFAKSHDGAAFGCPDCLDRSSRSLSFILEVCRSLLLAREDAEDAAAESLEAAHRIELGVPSTSTLWCEGHRDDTVEKTAVTQKRSPAARRVAAVSVRCLARQRGPSSLSGLGQEETEKAADGVASVCRVANLSDLTGAAFFSANDLREVRLRWAKNCLRTNDSNR